MIGHLSVEDTRPLGGSGGMVTWKCIEILNQDYHRHVILYQIFNLLQSHNADLFGFWGIQFYASCAPSCLHVRASLNNFRELVRM